MTASRDGGSARSANLTPPCSCDESRLCQVAECRECPALWASRPTLESGVVTEPVAGGLLVWTDKGCAALNSVGGAIVSFMDGSGTLAEFAVDLSAVSEGQLTEVESRAVLFDVVAGLDAISAVDGLDGCSTRLADSAAPLDNEDRSGAIDRPTTVAQRSDGRWEVSTTVKLAAGTLDSPTAGDPTSRSLTEQVPHDSCLGQKLRLGQSVAKFGIDIDAQKLMVRCDVEYVEEELLERLDGSLEGPSGPSVAFVVGPYEGSGPPRVYDYWGRRRGRPRTSSDCVDLVEELAVEFNVQNRPLLSSGMLAIPCTSLTIDGRVVLIPRELLGDRLVARILRRCGVSPSAGVCLLDPELGLHEARVKEDRATGTARQALLAVPHPASITLGEVFRAIRPAYSMSQPDREIAIGRLAEAASQLQPIGIDTVLDALEHGWSSERTSV